MSWDERLGLLVMFFVGGVLGAMALVLAPGGAANALAGCVTPTSDSSAPRLDTAVFDDLSEDVVSQAENAVCHELRSPDDGHGWALKGIDVMRASFNGRSDWNARLRYTLGVYSTPSARYMVLSERTESSNLTLTSTTGESFERVSLRGRPAELYRRDGGGLLIRWRQDGLIFEAEVLSAQGGPTEIDERDLLAFLASVH